MESPNLLQLKNFSKTLPRRLILQAISTCKKRHFSAEDILISLKKENEIIVSRATVFRTVKLFARQGILRPIDLGKGCMMYEMSEGASHHDHLYCLECGAIIEFHEPAIEKLQEAVCMQQGFKPSQHTLRISGICARCKKNKRPSSRLLQK